MNTYGTRFRVTVFGESHGPGVGVTIDGCPPGLEMSEKDVQIELDRRAPGKSIISSARFEQDKVRILSGIFNGKTSGAPITMIIDNKDVDSSCYDAIKNTPRPGHSDFTARMKYRGFNDHRGGGIFSGRLTASIVMAGAVAKKALSKMGVSVVAHTLQIGNIKARWDLKFDVIRENKHKNDLRCGDLEVAENMKKLIFLVKSEKDSIGGIIECRIINVPIGLGEPFFDSLEGEISKMMFAIPGVKGVEFGSGFKCAEMRGSEHNDPFTIVNGEVVTTTNYAGGVLGGISNGMPIIFKVAIKPTSSIGKKQKSVNLQTLKNEEVVFKGRADPCIVPRAIPVVEGGMAIVLLDLMLRAKGDL